MKAVAPWCKMRHSHFPGFGPSAEHSGPSAAQSLPWLSMGRPLAPYLTPCQPPSPPFMRQRRQNPIQPGCFSATEILSGLTCNTLVSEIIRKEASLHQSQC